MTENLFKWRHFEKNIILLCVRWYLKYPLSYRNLLVMMAERGITVTHTTIMRWVHKYSPILDERTVEQDHRFIKKKTNHMLGFKSFETAKRTISGIEIVHMIHKGQIEEIHYVLSEVQFISNLMADAA